MTPVDRRATALCLAAFCVLAACGEKEPKPTQPNLNPTPTPTPAPLEPDIVGGVSVGHGQAYLWGIDGVWLASGDKARRVLFVDRRDPATDPTISTLRILEFDKAFAMLHQEVKCKRADAAIERALLGPAHDEDLNRQATTVNALFHSESTARQYDSEGLARLFRAVADSERVWDEWRTLRDELREIHRDLIRVGEQPRTNYAGESDHLRLEGK